MAAVRATNPAAGWAGSGQVAARPGSSVDWLTSFGLVATVALLFSISGGMLWLVGYNYDGLTGNPATKIHPSTYLLVLVFAWRACTFGNPVGYMVAVADRRPASTLMAVISIVLLVVVVARQRPGMAGMVDTFVAPALLVMMLAEDDEKTFARMQTVVHAIMTVNALLALFEFATKTLLFPYRLDGEAFMSDLRSTALQGHPLSNATVTSIYVLSLLSGARSLSTPLRLGLVGLQFCALVVFGGRSGMVLTILLGGVYVLIRGVAQLRTGRVNLLGAALVIMLAALLPLAIALAGYYGFFDALLERFVSDSGSANARVEMFDLFRHLELRDLIVGPDVDLLDSMRRITGLEQGIDHRIDGGIFHPRIVERALDAGGLAAPAVDLLVARRQGCPPGPLDHVEVIAFEARPVLRGVDLTDAHGNAEPLQRARVTQHQALLLARLGEKFEAQRAAILDQDIVLQAIAGLG